MADTVVLTDLVMHQFDTDEQAAEHVSEIGENDLVFTDDTTQERLDSLETGKQDKLTAGDGIVIDNGVISATGMEVTIDSELSNTSVNPVQNKVIASKISEIESAKANDSDVVHKSGDTMTGNLTMNDGDVIFKDTQTAISPSADAWHKSIVQFLDKDSVRVGWMQPYFKTDGTMELRLVSYDPVNGNKYLNIGSNGNLVWDNKSVITTAGGTFTGNIAIQKETPQINMKSTVMDITSGGWAAGRNTVAWCMDKNGYESAGIYNTTDTGGTARASLYVMSRKSGSQVQANLGVAVNSSGDTYATAPDTPDGAGSNEIVTASWAKAKFLPLAGGTMSGNITFPTANGVTFATGGVIKKVGSNGQNLAMMLKQGDWNTSYVCLYTGKFELHAGDGTTIKTLTGTKDGTFTWDGKNIALDANVLHKTGNETITGPITTKSQIIFENASSSANRGFLYKTSDGALSMGLSKSDNSGWQSYQSFFTSGQYQMTVSDGTNTKSLIAKSDGKLQWNSNDVLTYNYVGADSTNKWLYLYSGSDAKTGASLHLYPSSNVVNGSKKGGFEIMTAGGTAGGPSLAGYADGTLLWDDELVVCLVEEKKAENTKTNSWYRKYSDGWVEQGGRQDIKNDTAKRSVTFPIAMANKDNYNLQLTVTNLYRYACVAESGQRTTTGFTITTGDDSSSNNDGHVDWYVCGYAA